MAGPQFRTIALAGLVLANLAGQPARADDTPAEPVKGPPPSAFAQAIAAHPELRNGINEAAARCKVSASGVVSDCRLIREYPTNTPFGPALLAAASQFQVKPATHDGKPVDSMVVIDEGDFKADEPAGWLRKPSANDLLSVWPKDALRKGVSGQARVNCLVSVEGALFDCLVEMESPEGMDFGAAALAITPQFLMKPARRGGQPVVSEARIPINFKTYGPSLAGPGERKTANAAMVWAQAPTYADVAAAYPAKAREKKLGGRAILYCVFTSQGGLHLCQSIAEEPHGDGFTAAARKLAERFRAYPAADGKGFADASVQIPVTFDAAMLDPSSQVIGKPQWAALPSAEEVNAAFANLPKHVGTMRVLLDCVVQQGGWMGGCKVASETPPGRGLGQAALALTTKVRVITWTSEGLPVVGAHINVPIRYESGAPEAAAPPAKTR